MLASLSSHCKAQHFSSQYLDMAAFPTIYGCELSLLIPLSILWSYTLPFYKTGSNYLTTVYDLIQIHMDLGVIYISR